MLRTLLALATLAITAPAIAQTDPSLFSELNGKAIIDDAEIIEDGAEAELNKKLINFSDEYGRQMVIITVPTLQGNDIATFTLDYARHLGVGSKELDDGLVLLVAPNEREIRIEVGYGLEWWMTDYQSAAAVDIVKPFFREGDYTGGITAVTNKILPEITPAAEQKAADEAARDAERAHENTAAMRTFFDWVMIIIGFIASMFGLAFAVSIPKRLQKKRAKNWQFYIDAIFENPLSAPAALKNTEALKKRYKEAYNSEELRAAILHVSPHTIIEMDSPTRKERSIAIRSMPEIVTTLPSPTQNELRQAIMLNPRLITHYKDNQELVRLALSEDGMVIDRIDNPTEDQIRNAILQNPKAILKLKSATKAQRKLALTRNGLLIHDLPNPTPKERLVAINSRPHVVKDLPNLTDEEVAMSLTIDPSVLEYVISRATKRQINNAVMEMPSLITLLERPSAALQEIAIEHNKKLARKISNPSPATLAKIAELDEIKRQKEAAAKKRREEEEQRRRQRRRRSYSSSSSSFSGGGISSGGFSSGGFSSGGGSFGGGGASGSW